MLELRAAFRAGINIFESMRRNRTHHRTISTSPADGARCSSETKILDWQKKTTTASSDPTTSSGSVPLDAPSKVGPTDSLATNDESGAATPDSSC
jgi:hypothetical protein